LPPGTPPANGTTQLHGFVFPIAGGCLPKGDQLMPNALRPYRNGIHEGVDFYQVDNCTAITNGTPVQAVYVGRVIRADLNYVNPTQAEINAYLANPNTEESLDKFRGRQVWIDHGGGIVTRYAHLVSIAPGIFVGRMVTQGQFIASVGESGTPESLTSPGSEYHLHFEVRTGDSYLGKGQPPAVVRGLYQTLFSP
jgi:murein DD-endopeptidase MepM/ murein hydrolase activator NlpD